MKTKRTPGLWWACPGVDAESGLEAGSPGLSVASPPPPKTEGVEGICHDPRPAAGTLPVGRQL